MLGRVVLIMKNKDIGPDVSNYHPLEADFMYSCRRDFITS